MPFLEQISVSAALVLVTVVFQSAGMGGFVIWVRAFFVKNTLRLGLVHCAWLMVRVTTAILLLQLFEVTLWAGFYRWKCFSSWDPALYFSVTSYSTVGGDLMLPRAWRMVGPIESITGVLMCGLSVSILFAIVPLLVRHEERFRPVVPLVSERENTPTVGVAEQVPARALQ